MAHKLIVVSMDALFYEDLEYLSQKPTFGQLLKKCAMVKRVNSIFPTLTYPCHATMATGCFPAKHGVVNNTRFTPGESSPKWLWYHDAYQCKDIFDAAKEAGLTTAACGWPSTGRHPHIDYLVGEIAATTAKTAEEYQRDYQLTGTTQTLWDAACAQHIHYRVEDKSVFKFNTAACCEIIRQFAPDLVMLHIGEPDHYRHLYGVFSEKLSEALDLCEQALNDLLDAMDASGETYNLVVTADHTHIDVFHTAYPNALFAQKGLLTLDQEGNVTDWRAWSHETGMSATVYVKDPADEPMVYELLKQHQADLGISHVYTREKAAAEGFAGKFSFVLDTEGHTEFEDNWDLACRVPRTTPRSSHGFHPSKGPNHPILAIGPAFAEGTILETAHLTDGAPTWAAILGLSLPDTDGHALNELLK